MAQSIYLSKEIKIRFNGMNKKIIITGATGLIGKRLCTAITARGDKLTILTGNTSKASTIIKGAQEFINWDYNKPAGWEKYIDGKDAVIHLAGASIAGKRWNDDYKKIIYDSRIVSTKNLVEAISKAQYKPAVFISSSATGYYGNAGDETLTEESKSGNDFLSEVCKAWEGEAAKAEHYNVRRVSIRTGIVLSKDGGALKQMLTPYKLFLGGPLGSGRQWFPWIHIDDLINIYLYALDNPSIVGAVNAAAPNPVTMNEFARTLGKVLHRPSIFRVPLPVLKIAAGKAAEAVAASQRAIPKKLLDNEFKFKFEFIAEALMDTLK